jgi:hypothetical protein
MKELTTMDRLSKVWPQQPITLGEFAYSNGPLDQDTSSVGEMMHYLYAYSHGYAGCMKWLLADVPVAILRDNVPWLATGPSERCGLFYYDGTPAGRPKAIAFALRFLSDSVNAGSLAKGTFAPQPAETRIGAGYVYRGTRALFIGNTHYHSDYVSFDTESSRPANLMIRWDDNGMTIMATTDTKLQINPGAFGAAIDAKTALLEGKCARVAKDRVRWDLDLLRGETVRILK